jgi:hypothetical protein
VTEHPVRRAKSMTSELRQGALGSESSRQQSSDSGSQLEFENSAATLTEFFLVLTSSPTPVFRRCRRVWVNGNRMGVEYQRKVPESRGAPR